MPCRNLPAEISRCDILCLEISVKLYVISRNFAAEAGGARRGQVVPSCSAAAFVCTTHSLAAAHTGDHRPCPHGQCAAHVRGAKYFLSHYIFLQYPAKSSTTLCLCQCSNLCRIDNSSCSNKHPNQGSIAAAAPCCFVFKNFKLV